jgi:hypothetical protein
VRALSSSRRSASAYSNPTTTATAVRSRIVVPVFRTSLTSCAWPSDLNGAVSGR